jgi:uncharacterized protein (DUF488 family)
MPHPVYTIGHSNHAIKRFAELLVQHAVAAACDVRSTPYSRMNQQFNRETLRRSLAAVGIDYLFLGKELGARPADASCYRDGRVQYALLARTPLFRQGIERVEREAAIRRIALVCAEREPLDCHRTILISPRLRQRGLAVRHIHGDGGIEDHDEASRRLTARLGIPGPDMFRNENDVVADAYARRGEQMAYGGRTARAR